MASSNSIFGLQIVNVKVLHVCLFVKRFISEARHKGQVLLNEITLSALQSLRESLGEGWPFLYL